MKRDIFRTGIFVSIVCLLAFIFSEAGARLLHLAPQSLITLDTCVGYKLLPNTDGIVGGPAGLVPASANSQGFRDVEHTQEKDPGTYRVLVLGDSFTEASQVPMQDTFWRLLQSKADAEDLQLEVITMGISSWSTGQELLAYECYGRQYKPDLVLLNFNDSDLGDNAFRQDPFTPTFTLNDGALVLDESYKERITVRLSVRSMFYPGMLYFLKDNSELVRYLLFVHANTNAGKVIADTQVVPANTELAWELTRALLARLAADTRADGVPLLVTYLPTLSYSPESGKKLTVQAHANTFTFLDLTPALRTAEQSAPVQWPGDPHLTVFGHRIVADELFGTIRPHLSPRH